MKRCHRLKGESAAYRTRPKQHRAVCELVNTSQLNPSVLICSLRSFEYLRLLRDMCFLFLYLSGPILNCAAEDPLVKQCFRADDTCSPHRLASHGGFGLVSGDLLDPSWLLRAHILGNSACKRRKNPPGPVLFITSIHGKWANCCNREISVRTSDR